jgi:hypothetical protein
MPAVATGDILVDRKKFIFRIYILRPNFGGNLRNEKAGDGHVDSAPQQGTRLSMHLPLVERL